METSLSTIIDSMLDVYFEVEEFMKLEQLHLSIWEDCRIVVIFRTSGEPLQSFSYYIENGLLEETKKVIESAN